MRRRRVSRLRPGDFLTLPDGRVREIVRVNVAVEVCVTVEGDPETVTYEYPLDEVVEADRPHEQEPDDLKTCRGYMPADRP